MPRATALLALLLPFAAGAVDPVLFDNGDSVANSSTTISDDGLTAEDFVVASGVIGSSVYSVSGARFGAVQVGTDTGTWDGGIRWFLFSDDPEAPTPGELLASGNGLNVEREFVGPINNLLRQFEYRFDFDEPPTLDADRVYWLALSLGAVGFPVNWAASRSGDDIEGHPSVWGTVMTLPDPDADNWRPGFNDKGFVLTGVVLPDPIPVGLDVRPGQDPNRIDPESRGFVPVAVLGSASFDVREIDRTTLRFAPADALAGSGAAPLGRGGSRADVNRDGYRDLVSRYRIADTGIERGDTGACVQGRLRDGSSFEGCDAILTPPPPPGPDPVVFDNALPSGGSGIVITNDTLVADDFILDSASFDAPSVLVTGMRFFTSQIGLDASEWDGGVRWHLFADDPARPLPGVRLASGLATDVERKFLTPSGFVVNRFAHAFDFEPPLELETDTVYWLALNMGPTGDFDINWLISNIRDVNGQRSARGSVSALPDPGPDDWVPPHPVVPKTDKSFFLRGIVPSDTLPVEIDVRPRAPHGRIHPLSRGLVAVALFGVTDFDVADVDATTLAFGPDGARVHRGHVRFPDVDGDGVTDLVAHYRVRETGIAFGDTEACLTGETTGGVAFEGCDAIDTSWACGLGFELALLLPPLAWLRRRLRRSP